MAKIEIRALTIHKTGGDKAIDAGEITKIEWPKGGSMMTTIHLQNGVQIVTTAPVTATIVEKE